jgi:hypothetical protein
VLRQHIRICNKLIVGTLILASLVGCHKSRDDEFDPVAANQELLHDLGKFYEKYLTGDPSQVKDVLLEEAQLIDTKDWLPLGDKANLLFLTYCRLYVFHHRMNEESAAEAAWIKLRFWGLRRFELRGLTVEEAINEVNTFSPEKIIEIIEAADLRENNGLPAKYFRTTEGLNSVTRQVEAQLPARRFNLAGMLEHY